MEAINCVWRECARGEHIYSYKKEVLHFRLFNLLVHRLELVMQPIFQHQIAHSAEGLCWGLCTSISTGRVVNSYMLIWPRNDRMWCWREAFDVTVDLRHTFLLEESFSFT